MTSLLFPGLSSLAVVVMVQSAGWMIDELKLLQLFRFGVFMRLNLMGLFGSGCSLFTSPKISEREATSHSSARRTDGWLFT